VGVWTGQLDFSTADDVRETAREVEATGFRALWTGEAVGREVLTAAQLLLSATDSLIVATGIANIWARDALATAAGQLALGEAYPDRFILGIGVSHKPLLDVRGEDYRTPLTFMREYLDGMDHGYDVYRAVPPASRPPRLLAALGPKMLALAGERADGAHTYFVPPEHTTVAREVLGPDKLLVPEQVCVLAEDPTVARMSAYLDAMDDDPFVSPDGAPAARPPVPRVLAALRPPMLRLAAAKALGAISYLVPVEHTRRAREILGPDALLVAEQKVILVDRPEEARARARAALAWYLDTPNYLDNLRWLGFSDADLEGGGSDALVDALVAAGDEGTVVARVQEHLDAGATQVAVHALEDGDPFGLATLRRLAPLLLG
jgi:probable F420-dependent oxidoreductase